jgi:phosphotransferase system HPr (HPr) family protein
VTITNPQGFHMRPATAFAQLAGKFQSSVTLCKGTTRINGKSPLELMFLGAEQGTQLVLEVSGDDSEAALDALTALLSAPSADDLPEPSGELSGEASAPRGPGGDASAPRASPQGPEA